MVEHPAVGMAAPLGNRRVKNQANSRDPKVARGDYGNPEPSPAHAGKVQRLERELVPR